ncbi:hypothetical protein MRX96_052518, partial [Rhipicephalus microplus]
KDSGAEFVAAFGLRRRVAVNQEPSSGSNGYSLVSAASIAADSMVEAEKPCLRSVDQAHTECHSNVLGVRTNAAKR